ncbi:MAG TPA: Ig-like domain-containing protein, partial [Verrucomicrobiota bacterium]|nr:Ig-like domain-containing protein [Verrucomicrobiota bacterium]
FEPSGIAVADLDKDTIKDLIVSTTDQLLFVLKGISGGTFNYYPGDPNTTFAIGEGEHAIAVDDVSNDANIDAVVANSESSNISVLLNNRIPKVYAATYITLEDKPIEITLRGSYGPLDYTIPGLPIYGSLELKPGYSMNQATISPVFTFTPTSDFYGHDYFYFYASDGVKQSTTARISIRIKPVNDQPSFEIDKDTITVEEDSTTTQIDNFIQNLNKGAVNESYQGIRYIVSNNKPELFTRQPTINYWGSLIFMPKKNAYGTAVVEVYAIDSGGTLDNGINTSETKTFTIVVNNVNDPPVISRIVGSTVINRNSTGALQVYISDIDNDVDDLILTATSSDQSIIANNNIVVSSTGPVRDVQFTPVQDAKGKVLLTFTLSDGVGGTATKSIFITVR